MLFLSDILPTGYQAALNARISNGTKVAIFGAGPVGLMSALCARFLGAETIFMVDDNVDRLEFAKQTYGVIPINFSDIDDPAEFILENTHNRGVDATIDAVGFEAKGSAVETVLTTLKIEAPAGSTAPVHCGYRRGGVVSVPGVYAGFIHGFLFGDAFDKGLCFEMGQTHVQKYLPELLDHIAND